MGSAQEKIATSPSNLSNRNEILSQISQVKCNEFYIKFRNLRFFLSSLLLWMVCGPGVKMKTANWTGLDNQLDRQFKDYKI